MSPADYEFLQFSVDAQLLRELGERLVGKPHVALGELVKNAYDADATRCIVTFFKEQIEIADNGNGMSKSDFLQKWMRIGSAHKRKEKTSRRFNRTLTGSKGIGRLAAQFLGSKIDVYSQSSSKSEKPVHAQVNWESAFEKNDLIEAGALVSTDLDLSLPDTFRHGTRIVISNLRESWTPRDFRELAAEFWFLQPPRQMVKDLPVGERFSIELRGVEESILKLFEIQSQVVLEGWIARIRGSISEGRLLGKGKLQLEFSDGEKHQATYSLPQKALDEAEFEILIFKLAGRQSAGVSVSDAREYFKRFGGVHIYDSGFRLPYYGGGDQDWLQIEMAHSHRLMQSKLVPDSLRPPDGTLQDLPTLSRVFGLVRVSTAKEAASAPKKTAPSDILSIQVTRDRLNDNHSFEELANFVRFGFDLYSYYSTSRRAKEAAKSIVTAAQNFNVRFSDVRRELLELQQKVERKVALPLIRAFEEFEKAEASRKQAEDAERVLLGALATAGMSSVALQHELAKELAALNGIVRKLEKRADSTESSDIPELLMSLKFWVESATQTRKLFAPFFSPEDRVQLKRMRARRLLHRLVSNLAPLLRGISVELDDVSEEILLPKGTLAGWNAVFQNLLINAVNASLGAATKRIRIRTSKGGRGRVNLYLEDTGVGVELADSDELFLPFVRRLELPEDRQALGLGGMGMGLTIARMVGSTFGCELKFVKPISPFKTSLELSWFED